jgi:hypothetical protein
MLLTILLAQSTGQQPGQNTGTTNSGEIVDGAIDGADLIVKSFANDWAELASGTSSIYTAVVAVSMGSIPIWQKDGKKTRIFAIVTRE